MQATAPPLTAEQLERLLEPFAGAPQDVLAIVLDACRYPTELMDATQWAARPEVERGPAKESWPPPVRLLAERAPRTLQFLTQDIASTAALGSAFQSQPNDVWLAFGRVTLARQAQAAPPAAPPPAEAPEPARQPAPPPAPRRDTEAQPAGTPPMKSPAPEPVQAAPAQAPAEAPPVVVQTPPASVVTTAPPAPVTVVTTPAPVATVDPMGSALVGGMVGLGAGLLISELVHDDDWGAPGYGYGYRPPYAVPPPYAPAGGARYDAARALQEDRQAAARERQGDRQASLATRQQERQGNVTERQDGRQAAAGERSQQRQATREGRQTGRDESASARQASRGERQGGRQDTRQQREQQRGGNLSATARGEQRASPGSAGQERRAAATAGQPRAQRDAGGDRFAGAQRPAAAQPRPAPQAARAPDWGPARGMSGGAEVSRARAPSGGFSAGGAGGGGRAAGARAGGGGRRR